MFDIFLVVLPDGGKILVNIECKYIQLKTFVTVMSEQFEYMSNVVLNTHV